MASTVRDERTRVLATLVGWCGDLDLAEDGLQDAVVRALETWPRDGIPAIPRAWLTTAARRTIVDRVRRESLRMTKEREGQRLLTDNSEPGETSESAVNDDVLRLIFTCCHPSLSREAQVALSLRTLCGLSTTEVAHALLVPEPTMAKRLSRAKAKIALARIPYRIPDAHELPERLAGVLTTVYLVFNEGYARTTGAAAIDGDLTVEALRLGGLISQLMPDEASVLGLNALMLLHDSRRAARVEADGAVVLLADQDRSLWNGQQIRRGVELVGEALRRTPEHPDPFVVQAAIAACHALAPTSDDTDWAAIVSWFDVLVSIQPDAVTELNRAVAIAERDGPAIGLPLVESITSLNNYPWWHATRAELLLRLDRPDEAVAAFDRALALDLNEPLAAQLRERRARLNP